MLWLLLKELPERSLTFGSKATYLVTVSAAAAPDNRSPLYKLIYGNKRYRYPNDL